MYIVCITGNIAMGKTLVGNILKNQGYQIIKIDEISTKVLMESQNELLKKYPELLENGVFSKTKLKKIIFERQENASEIEKILHRKIIFKTILKVILESLKGRSVLLLEIPLFMEYNLNKFFDSIVVYCDRHTQAKRIYQRDGVQFLNEKLKLQGNIDDKKEKGTYLIDNSGTIDKTIEQIKMLKFYGFPIYLNLIMFTFLIYSIVCLVNIIV